MEMTIRAKAKRTPPAVLGHWTESVERPSCETSSAVRLSAGVTVMLSHASIVSLVGGPGYASTVSVAYQERDACPLLSIMQTSSAGSTFERCIFPKCSLEDPNSRSVDSNNISRQRTRNATVAALFRRPVLQGPVSVTGLNRQNRLTIEMARFRSMAAYLARQ